MVDQFQFFLFYRNLDLVGLVEAPKRKKEYKIKFNCNQKLKIKLAHTDDNLLALGKELNGFPFELN